MPGQGLATAPPPTVGGMKTHARTLAQAESVFFFHQISRVNIMEALQWANNKLRKAGIDSPMLDAEILLAHTLEASKAWLFSHFTDKLKSYQQEKFHGLVDRRASHEPIAYIVGTKEFYGRSFHVNPSVLIPRPETETMVEVAMKKLEDKDPERTLIADIGAGSGALGITLAAETHLPVIATDIDPSALEVATKNAAALLNEKEIDFQQANLAEHIIRIFKTIRGQTSVKTSSVYPFKTLLLTANLPYLSESKMEAVYPDIGEYEPQLALVSGVDGLDAYWGLFRQLRAHRKTLPRELIVLIEIDPEQRPSAEKLILHNFPNAKLEVHQDLHGYDRVISSEM